MKIVDYQIVQAHSIANLSVGVNKAIRAEGWQPIGGVMHNQDDGSYVQAMVKYEQPAPVIPPSLNLEM